MSLQMATGTIATEKYAMVLRIAVIVTLVVSSLGCTRHENPVSSNQTGAIFKKHDKSDTAENVAPSPDDQLTLALVGKYYRGDGMGLNLFLTLAADHTFCCKWTGCLGAYGDCAGTWSQKGKRIIINTISRDGMFDDDPLDDLDIVYHKGKIVLVPLSVRSLFNKWGPEEYTCFQEMASQAKGRKVTGVPRGVPDTMVPGVDDLKHRDP